MTEQSNRRLSVDLADQVAIVTGAARGLGQTIARDIAASGAKVACVDVNEGLLAETVERITAAGGMAAAFPCDVTDGQRVTAVVGEVVGKWGRLDILVNNAGVTRDNVVLRMKDEEWDLVLGINLRGTFLFTRTAAKPMIKGKRGRIINIASVSGMMGNPGQANYSASKAGVIGLTRTVSASCRNATSRSTPWLRGSSPPTWRRSSATKSSNRSRRRPPWAGSAPPRTSPTPCSFSPATLPVSLPGTSWSSMGG